MLKISRIILSIIVIGIGISLFLNPNSNIAPYMMLALGALTLLTGIDELQKDKKAFWGYMNIIISLFLFFISVQGFILK